MSSGDPHPELVDGLDIDRIAAAVRGCAGVEDLAAGAAGSVISYLPGRQIAGLRVGAEEITIQVRIRWGVIVTEVAREVRGALRGLVGGRRIDLIVAEMTDPDVPSIHSAQPTPVTGVAGKTDP